MSPAKLKWVPGEGFYVLCVVCPLLLGCQGKACLSTCCLSHGEAPREGNVSGVWLHMHGLSFYTRILSHKFLAFISAVYARPLPEATSTTVIEICTACTWAACCSMIYSSMQTKEVTMRAPTSVVSAPGHRGYTLTIALHLPSA